MGLSKMGRENFFSWRIQIKLINNRFIVWNVVKGLIITLIVLFVIFALIFSLNSGLAGLKMALIVCFWIALFIIVISILTLTVILGNKYPLEFVIDENGITMKGDSNRAKKVHRLALILGLLGRSSATAGAGALGVAGEIETCSWKEIDSVKIYEDVKVVAAKKNIVQTMYIFCTENNFKEVSSLIIEKATQNK